MGPQGDGLLLARHGRDDEAPTRDQALGPADVVGLVQLRLLPHLPVGNLHDHEQPGIRPGLLGQ